eukprot:CAMPEP_0172625958 /NCGR_PEP_ID=MMETSP1068-20121228/146986_1 /TAXON_ID=35684 /ORGANISM="Pseudopedinella elastica, Strain CCMP716" /LENGTH=190 /DNA_ID=CAMNT_0013435411 /DNA_START=217 /DNA_END=790 /DNA_ORIENTATION=-
MWFSIGDASFELRGGQGFLVCPGASGAPPLFQLGGPLEPFGRLRYIDGCSDTLLVGPSELGQPCLNHLHFPPGTRQTLHTHPTARVGMVASGRGECVLGDGGSALSLVPGAIFEILPGVAHAFRTLDEGPPMTVVAWHPDSDFGPTNDDHPMVNRTIVDGQSASMAEGYEQLQQICFLKGSFMGQVEDRG